VESGSISGKAGKDLLDLLLLPSSDPDFVAPSTPLSEAVAQRGWAQVDDSARVEEACRAVLAAFPSEVAQAQRGNKRIFGFLSGQALKHGKEGGQLNPAAVSKKLTQLIAELPPPPPAS
jgi:Asp-tRNA(Asn)/Glu-tRNA(Gln) amidotransferase B subunit